jgi:hypothetical protein
MFSITKISEGTGENCFTYSMTTADEGIVKFSCWKGATYFIGDLYLGKWTFYSMGRQSFPLPENIRKQFAKKGKPV